MAAEVVESSLALTAEVKGDLKTVIAKVTEELKQQGFGVLTSIDVTATLKAKINEDFRPYVILGACNPKFAHKTLSLDDNVGLLLPCNVVVEQVNDDLCKVKAINPKALIGFLQNPALTDIANDAYEKLSQAMANIK